MAEGGLDDFEMQEHDDKYQKYSDEQLNDERDNLQRDIHDAYEIYNIEDNPMPENVKVEYDEISNKLVKIHDEMIRRQDLEAATEPAGDGKTVTKKWRDTVARSDWRTRRHIMD